MQELSVAADVAAEVAESGVAVVTLPQTNLFLQARGVHTTVPRGLTAVRPLLEAGATLAAGGDNVRDPFNAMGRGDPLETASLMVTAGHLTPAEAFASVTAHARTVMGLPPVEVSLGFPADLLAIRATSLADALAGASQDRMVWKGGRLVSRTTVTQEFPE
jgi:cytosine deaminase